MVRWLLEHGARINYVVQGMPRCLPLISAATEGYLDVVKLLVEHGADVGATWRGLNAIRQAEDLGHPAVAEYLRSVNPGGRINTDPEAGAQREAQPPSRLGDLYPEDPPADRAGGGSPRFGEGADAVEEVSEQDVIDRFAALMNGFIASPPATARAIIDAVVEQFRTLRVKGVRDKLQFEWGASSPHELNRFADIRREHFRGWEAGRYQWLGVSRELSAGQGDDDTALCAFLYFDPAGPEEPSGTVACRLENLDDRLRRLLGNAYVTQVLGRRPSRITAFATDVG